MFRVRERLFFEDGAGPGSPAIGSPLPNEEGFGMRKSVRALCVAVTAAVALLALSAGSASAFYSHVFSSSFGSAGSGAGQVSLAPDSGVAVNFFTHGVFCAGPRYAG